MLIGAGAWHDIEEQMQGTPEISELLRELVLLSRTRVDSDSPDNPVQTREARLLQLRMKLVRAIVTQRLSEM